MSTWYERLVDEKSGLADRLGKLDLFLESDDSSKLAKKDLDLLHRQAEVMADYLDILTSRLERSAGA